MRWSEETFFKSHTRFDHLRLQGRWALMMFSLSYAGCQLFLLGLGSGLWKLET